MIKLGLGIDEEDAVDESQTTAGETGANLPSVETTSENSASVSAEASRMEEVD